MALLQLAISAISLVTVGYIFHRNRNTISRLANSKPSQPTARPAKVARAAS